MTDIIFAVIVPTYNRGGDKTRCHLTNLFESLKSQTMQKFKLFLIGDDYEPAEEFEEICNKFYAPDRIFYKNYPGISYRIVFKDRRNKWSSGGIHANYLGIKHAVEQGLKYYLHLDDDDTWYPNHVQEHYNTIQALPLSDFQFTASKYKTFQLPICQTATNTIEYNNRLPQAANIVHSTWCFNLETLGGKLLALFEERMAIIEKIRNGEMQEISLEPFDMDTIKMINKNVQLGSIKVIYIPNVTCCKLTDGNYPL